MNRPERVKTCYTIRKDHKNQIDALRLKYVDKYYRLRSDIIDVGISIALSMMQNHGPDWFYENKNDLPELVSKIFTE